ncbi:Nucleoredoxin protein 2 [Phytophthora cinnamomi]|uniref:Nucleoredoxin protein 2 n=1 Tax=Phytophthora cinnamomi TaxID=4785 RepID=UPI00355A8BF6|nr:Nucleoredoxin protein 2 [Phytophthora cinnamomi]
MVNALLHGTKLVNAKGEAVDGSDVGQSGLLALYFAANWCPDCRAFQPKLNDFYADVNASTQQLDVVFLSSDTSEEDQQMHFSTKHGDWWMVPFKADVRNELRRKYGIRNGKDDAEVGVTHRNSGIPALVIIRPDGEVLDFQGAQQVENEGIKALADWQNKVQD